MSDCLFCKIVAGEIPSEFIYEDDTVIAFKDINPMMNTHLLIVPKKHYSDATVLADEAPETLTAVVKTAKILSEKLFNKVQYKLLFNTVEDQTVFHVHGHFLSEQVSS
ncbi:MAG: HIT domain-containing protein [Bifidobacteriaceae bacterium]|jgi:histidine triad (HIT) family protein|nr:HIT domain-containing protein [Bifidobacteriaceae bacterium]